MANVAIFSIKNQLFSKENLFRNLLGIKTSFADIVPFCCHFRKLKNSFFSLNFFEYLIIKNFYFGYNAKIFANMLGL